MPDYTPADLAYFSANYLTLDELCADRADSPDEVRRLIAERRLPAPSYVLPDGTGMFPADYFRLVDEAGGPDGLREHFAARHREANGKDLDQDWEMYLDGIWGISRRVIARRTARISTRTGRCTSTASGASACEVHLPVLVE